MVVTPGGMHVLVTGGAGFIGTHVVARLLAIGHRVTVLDDLSVGTRERVPDGVPLLVGDVRDPRVHAEALVDVDAVVHLAARVTIRASLESFVDDADVNLLGTLRLVAACRGTPVRRFVLASSMAVYADSTPGNRVTEAHLLEPISPYGVSKLAAERIAAQVLPLAGVSFTALRFFNTFGPGQTYTPYVGVATIFATRLMQGQPITVFGDGEQERDFVHVADVADAVAASLTHAPGTYNVGSGTGTTVNALARMLIDRLAPGACPSHAPSQHGELRHSVADISAARRALGYAPSRTLAAHLDDVIGSVAATLHR